MPSSCRSDRLPVSYDWRNELTVMSTQESHYGPLNDNAEIPRRGELDKADDAIEVLDLSQAALRLVPLVNHLQEKVELFVIIIRIILDDTEIDIRPINLEDAMVVAS